MAAKSKVTYLGPKDDREVNTIYRLPAAGADGEDLVLHVGIAREATDAQIKALKKDKAHKFADGDVDVGSDDAGAPWPDYPTLSAEDVVERIGDPAETPNADFAREIVAWEKAHDKRKTVVDAAEHQAEAYEPQGEEG